MAQVMQHRCIVNIKALISDQRCHVSRSQQAAHKRGRQSSDAQLGRTTHPALAASHHCPGTRVLAAWLCLVAEGQRWDGVPL